MTTTYRLANDEIALTLDESGALLALVNLRTGHDYVAAPGRPLWKLVFRDDISLEHAVSGERQQPRITHGDGTLQLDYDTLAYGAAALPIALQLRLRLDGDQIVAEARIGNTSAVTVGELWFPLLDGVGTVSGSPAADALLLPEGYGRRVAHPLARFGPDVSNAGYCGEARQRTLLYPGPASLPWLALTGGGETLALFSLDQTLETIALGVERHRAPPRLSLRIVRFPEVRPGETWRSPPAAVAAIHGGWHVAADRYRRWLNGWLPWAEPPAWVRDMPAWQLTIMRAQYGAVTWDYAGIRELWRGAQAAGIDTLFLFAWWDAGHDNRYPEPYTPSTLMGGQEQLVAALRAVEGEGGHAILYTQGRLIDPATPFYQRAGAALAVKSIWGTEYREQYNFWHESAALAACSGKAFAMACPSHERWRDVLLAQGRQVRGLGAGGVLYDQIGGAVPPYLCYDHSHPHSRPSTGFAAPMVAHMGQVRAALKEGRPDFAVVTENVSDVLCSSYDIVHGGGFGSRAAPESFPELLRYTIPQLIVTNRMVGVDEQPDLSYAMLHGLRFDLEPSGARGHMGMHPELAARVRQLCAVRRALAPSLLRGAYADDEGVDAGDAQVAAKAFVGDGQAAVVCWNQGVRPAMVTPRLHGQCSGQSYILDPDPERPAAIAPGGLAVFVYGS